MKGAKQKGGRAYIYTYNIDDIDIWIRHFDSIFKLFSWVIVLKKKKKKQKKKNQLLL